MTSCREALFGNSESKVAERTQFSNRLLVKASGSVSRVPDRNAPPIPLDDRSGHLGGCLRHRSRQILRLRRPGFQVVKGHVAPVRQDELVSPAVVQSRLPLPCHPFTRPKCGGWIELRDSRMKNAVQEMTAESVGDLDARLLENRGSQIDELHEVLHPSSGHSPGTGGI